jgi:NSS family neurotransmitter:Na+ symporter
VLIIRRGVKRGLEAAIRWFMPLLLVLLVVLLGYASTTSGFAKGVEFVFAPDWSEVTPRTVLVALAHAFFTLSVGMGALMAYGAYVPAQTGIVTSVGVIVGLDTLVSIGAALVVFPLVFANGLAPGEGPGLMFVTLPLAFGQLPFGLVFGALFFLLVCLAAITSTISMCEPVLAYLVEEYNAKRARVAVSWGVMCWLLGIGSALSFNVWSDLDIVGGRNVFEMADLVSQSILLPVGGMLIAIFAGWVLPLSVVGAQLGLDQPWVRVLWRALVGVVAPLGVFAVLLGNLIS